MYVITNSLYVQLAKCSNCGTKLTKSGKIATWTASWNYCSSWVQSKSWPVGWWFVSAAVSELMNIQVRGPLFAMGR